MKTTRHHTHTLAAKAIRLLAVLIVCMSALNSVTAQEWRSRYTTDHPLIIVGDWDKPPYEFLNRNGQPAGINIEIMTAVFQKLNIPFEFVLKDWGIAKKMFADKRADIILDNPDMYKRSPLRVFTSSNVIHSEHLLAASLVSKSHKLTRDELLEGGLVLKSDDYSNRYFVNIDSAKMENISQLSPKVALIGISDGVNRYFLWGEEQLKWKIREYGLDNVVLNKVQIPVNYIKVIGFDRKLIEDIDDQFSRLNQSGAVNEIRNEWLHPDKVEKHSSSKYIYIIFGTLLLLALLYSLSRLARHHVNSATRKSSELNNIMNKALHMGNFDVTEYDIKNDIMVNRYGNILPPNGITLEEFISHIHPAEQNEFRHKVKQLISGHERKFELNKRWKPFDGGDTWLSFQGHAILELDHDGQPAYIINAVHDVTLEEHEDYTIRLRSQRYSQLANLPFLAMSFYDKNGKLIELNDSMADLCGITKNPNMRAYWENANVFDIPQFKNVYQRGAQYLMQACMHMEYPDQGLDHYIEYEMRPLFNDRGLLCNYFCSTLDVTEHHDYLHEMRDMERQMNTINEKISVRKLWLSDLHSKGEIYKNKLAETRQQLALLTDQAADSMLQKSTYMASMTHELRTPLNVIIAFTNKLQQCTPDEREEYVRIIRNNTDMLDRLINDMLDAATLTRKAITVRKLETDIPAAFNDICMILQQSLKGTEAVFIKDNPYDTLVVNADTDRLQQLLTNIVSNAVKFTRQGHIRVGYRVCYEAEAPGMQMPPGATTSTRGLYFYCEDTGCGIANDKQQLIFDRFVKLDEYVQGAGLGLYICKYIVEQYNGHIGVESQGLGKGSTFWFWVPC